MNTILNKFFFVLIILQVTFSCQSSSEKCIFFAEGKFHPEEDIFENYYLIRKNNMEKIIHSDGTINYSNMEVDHENCVIKIIPQDIGSNKSVKDYITYSDIRVVGDTVYTKKTFYQDRVGVSENTFFIKAN